MSGDTESKIHPPTRKLSMKFLLEVLMSLTISMTTQTSWLTGRVRMGSSCNMMLPGVADCKEGAVLFPTELTQKLAGHGSAGEFPEPTGSMAEWGEHGLSHQTDVDLSSTSFTYSLTLGNLLDLFVPQFQHIVSLSLLWRLMAGNGQCLAPLMWCGL